MFVQVPKSAENLALYLACLKLGLVYVPLNIAYTEAELDYFGDAEPVLYVGDQARADVACAQLRTGNFQQLLDFGLGDAGHRIQQSVATEPRKAYLAAILYTSGTTGVRRGDAQSRQFVL